MRVSYSVRLSSIATAALLLPGCSQNGGSQRRFGKRHCIYRTVEKISSRELQDYKGIMKGGARTLPRRARKTRPLRRDATLYTWRIEEGLPSLCLLGNRVADSKVFSATVSPLLRASRKLGCLDGRKKAGVSFNPGLYFGCSYAPCMSLSIVPRVTERDDDQCPAPRRQYPLQRGSGKAAAGRRLGLYWLRRLGWRCPLSLPAWRLCQPALG